jgi:hypothetical protein
MRTSFRGGRSLGTRREPPTMGKQLVNFITCDCESSAPFFVIYKAGRKPTPYWWYACMSCQVIQLPNSLSHPDPPINCDVKEILHYVQMNWVRVLWTHVYFSWKQGIRVLWTHVYFSWKQGIRVLWTHVYFSWKQGIRVLWTHDYFSWKQGIRVPWTHVYFSWNQGIRVLWTYSSIFYLCQWKSQSLP